MVRILYSEPAEVINHSGVSRITIPNTWAEIIGQKPGTKITRAILQGSEGLHFGTWVKNNQPTIEEVPEHQLRKIIKDATNEETE